MNKPYSIKIYLFLLKTMIQMQNGVSKQNIQEYSYAVQEQFEEEE